MPAVWAKAYRPLHPMSLAVQLLVLIAAEVVLFATYGAHDARFHWATHFLVALTISALLLLAGLLLTGAPRPRFVLLVVLGFHLFAMAPDVLFRVGVPHYRWMDLFLGHITVHYLPGGDVSWLLIALTATAGYIAALTLWLRARSAEADAGMPPGVGLTGGAVLRPQFDPRVVPLAAEDYRGFEGPTVVLLHGLGATAAFWRPVARDLATRQIPALVPDLLGFGASLRLGTHFHLDDQAAAVIRLLDAHNRGPVLLVAHSYGAAVAATMVTDRPDLVHSLVLVEPAAFADAGEARRRIGGRNWLANKAMNGSQVADWACGLMCLFRIPLTALAPRIARHYSADVSRDIARGAVTYVWPAYRDALASLLRDNPLPQWLQRPTKPTTVIVGENDRTVIADSVATLVGPDVRFERFPGTHALPFEHPGPLAALIALRWNEIAEFQQDADN
jgi:pimeloyl-ACP methyl ester carboxylesterase